MNRSQRFSRRRGMVWFLTVGIAVWASVARAATQYGAGTFTWDNGITAAWGASGGPYNAVWNAGNDAVIEGPGGTVTLSGAINPASTFVNSTGLYTFVGGGLPGGSLTKTNSGTLTLTGANTYTSNTAIYGGMLEIGGSGTLGNGSYAGAITNNATFKVNTSANQSLNGVIRGTGCLIKAGSGTLTLTQGPGGMWVDPFYTGGTIVEAGELDLDGANQNNGVVNGNLVIHSGAKVKAMGTWEGPNRSFGTANLSGGPLGQNCVTNVVISNGTLEAYTGDQRSLAPFGKVTMTGGTISGTALEWTGVWGGPKVETLASSNPCVISAGIYASPSEHFESAPASALPFIVAKGTVPSGVDLLVSGVLTGAVPLTKSGVGVMVLAATNTYDGSTTVNSGSLVVNGAIATTNPVTVTVKADATLGGAGSIDGLVTVESGGHLAPGDVNSHGTLTLTASTLNFNDGAELDCRIGGTTLNPTNGTVDLTGADSTIAFGGHATINISRSVGSAAVPNGKVFVIFRYKSLTPPTLPEWTFNYIADRWRDGKVSLGTGMYTNSIVLTVDQAPKGTLLSVR